mmetsp:Transcript_51752/g.133602  ORF Transcript_51752/g.133602 Transcript_51752/m.133602 type:complete len:222 (+) Transcript_51752:552-1217(+)
MPRSSAPPSAPVPRRLVGRPCLRPCPCPCPCRHPCRRSRRSPCPCPRPCHRRSRQAGGDRSCRWAAVGGPCEAAGAPRGCVTGPRICSPPGCLWQARPLRLSPSARARRRRRRRRPAGRRAAGCAAPHPGPTTPRAARRRPARRRRSGAAGLCRAPPWAPPCGRPGLSRAPLCGRTGHCRAPLPCGTCPCRAPRRGPCRRASSCRDPPSSSSAPGTKTSRT